MKQTHLTDGASSLGSAMHALAGISSLSFSAHILWWTLNRLACVSTLAWQSVTKRPFLQWRSSRAYHRTPTPCRVCALSCSGYSWKGNPLAAVWACSVHGIHPRLYCTLICASGGTPPRPEVLGQVGKLFQEDPELGLLYLLPPSPFGPLTRIVVTTRVLLARVCERLMSRVVAFIARVRLEYHTPIWEQTGCH